MTSAARMQAMINDVLGTRVATRARRQSSEACIEAVANLRLTIDESDADGVAQLADRRRPGQMVQLFQNPSATR
jgi:hypothetical protein